MISDQDITKLSKTFVTKKEFQALKYEVGDLRVEVGELKDSMEEKFTHLDVKLDSFLGRLDTVILENSAGAVAQYRHERHIQALADHVGFTLPEE